MQSFRSLRSTVVTHLALIIFLSALSANCSSLKAQASDVGAHGLPEASPLSMDTVYRVQALIRSRVSLLPDAEIELSKPTRSQFTGYDLVTVSVAAEDKVMHTVQFLLSSDRKTLVQFSVYDIGGNPKDAVPPGGHPARGGPITAPVLVVVFDDLECPFCAKVNQEIFPALTDHYGDQVRVVYRDYPLDGHAWARRAASDANCLAQLSAAAYWKFVDQIHANAGSIGSAKAPSVSGTDTTTIESDTKARAVAELDMRAKAIGASEVVNQASLNQCLNHPDDAAIDSSLKLGRSIGVEATPVIFVNGMKIDGAAPLQSIYKMIDSALPHDMSSSTLSKN